MPRLTAAVARAQLTWEVPLRDGLTVLLRRASMATLLMSGHLPLTLFRAVLVLDEGTSGEAMLRAPEHEREAMLESLRAYACAVVVDPVVVREADDDPTHVPVEFFTLEELLVILNARPPEAPAEAADVPRLTEDEAARFRGSAEAVATAAVPAGDDVSPAALGVDSPDVTIVHG